MKRFLIVFIALVLFFRTAVSLALAKIEQAQTGEATSTPQVVGTVDSYALFWPLVAGKTSDEPLYFLKSLKEKVIGMFIFNSAKKAEHQIILSTKRLLEIEKLSDSKKSDKALETVKKAKSHMEKALSLSDNKDGLGKVKVEVENKLNNITTFLPHLKNKTEDNTDVVLDEINSQIKDLQSKLQ